MSDKQHGGRRPGAGRPADPDERKIVTYALPESLREWVAAEAARRKVSKTAVVEEALRRMQQSKQEE